MPPKKRAKRNACGYLPSHDDMYGVQVTARDPATKAPTSILCRFCATFGREEADDGSVRKRARTNKPKYWEGKTFRSDYFKAHMKEQHKAKFAEYSALSSEARAVFFDAATQSTGQMTMFAFGEARRSSIRFLFDRDIIEVIIGEMMWHPDDIDGLTHARMMAPFTQYLALEGEESADNGACQYIVVIKNPLQFNMVLGHLRKPLL